MLLVDKLLVVLLGIDTESEILRLGIDLRNLDLGLVIPLVENVLLLHLHLLRLQVRLGFLLL